LRIGLFVERGRVAKWQAEALRRLAAGHEFVVYDCSGRVRPKRNWRAHGDYYALNLLQARRASGGQVPLPKELVIVARHSFQAEEDEGWDRLPATLLTQIASDRVSVLIKFGLGLLRVPPADQLAVPILSYHHGDPRRFRGRPAGFWEMRHGERRLGQVVQRLSNRLDGGEVLAFAETRVVPHSWRATLALAYRASPLLLDQAVARALAASALPIPATGCMTRLPASREVAKVASRMLTAKLRHLAYGAFAEKEWRVSTAPMPAGWSPLHPEALDDPANWTELPQLKPYRFLADPFFAPDGAVLAEAMRPDGRGSIVRFADGALREVTLVSRGHVSYPSVLQTDGVTFLLPEIASWSPQRIYQLDGGSAADLGDLEVAGRPRLLDPTLFTQDGRFYLFGNVREEGSGVLRLWSADHVRGPYVEHPDSPIRISPQGSRMGGSLFVHEGRLYRPGQDLSGAFGDGLCFFEVEAISPEAYAERLSGHLRFRSCRGPHTMNVFEGRVVFDHYRDSFSPFAGFRRLRRARSG
jgi:hypothetical protein